MLKRLELKYKQFVCLHWWGDITKRTYGRYGNFIICTEVRTWEITENVRICLKCNLEDSIIINEEYLGWN